MFLPMPWPIRPAPISPTFFFVMALMLLSRREGLTLLLFAAGDGDDRYDDDARQDQADAGIGAECIEHRVKKIDEKSSAPYARHIRASARNRCAPDHHDGDRGEQEAFTHVEGSA